MKLISILLIVFSISALQAQEALTAAGGDVTGTEGSVSYSVGQLVYTTYEGTDASVSNGVQQPYEISVVVGIKEAKGIELLCSAYPNPTTDLLKLKVENVDLDELSFYLYSMNGNLLETQKIIDKETAIQMSQYLQGTYILKIISSNTEAKTFAIIKN